MLRNAFAGASWRDLLGALAVLGAIVLLVFVLTFVGVVTGLL